MQHDHFSFVDDKIIRPSMTGLTKKGERKSNIDIVGS